MNADEFTEMNGLSKFTELPTLPDSAESSEKINQSFRFLMNKFISLPTYGNLLPIMLNAILNISPIVVQNLLEYGNLFPVMFNVILNISPSTTSPLLS